MLDSLDFVIYFVIYNIIFMFFPLTENIYVPLKGIF